MKTKTKRPDILTFNSKRSAINFALGYCVVRFVVKLPRGKFGICSPATARRHGLKVVF